MQDEKREPKGDPLYAHGKLHTAVGVLASDAGRIRERLIKACDSGLAAVGESDFPTTELRAQWVAIRSQIAGMGTVGADSAFDVAINVLSEDAAALVAEDIVELQGALYRWLRR